MTTITEKNVTINDFNRICRTCLSTRDLHTIYEDLNSDFTSIRFILSKYTEVKLDTPDKLPKQMCSNCLINLNSAYKFLSNCDLINKTLIECATRFENTIAINNSSPSHPIELVKCEIKQEPLEVIYLEDFHNYSPTPIIANNQDMIPSQVEKLHSSMEIKDESKVQSIEEIHIPNNSENEFYSEEMNLDNPNDENNCEDDFSCTPPEMRGMADNSAITLLPNKSRIHYEKQFNKFEEWFKENKVRVISEDVLLAYFELQHKKYKASTLWTTYSMLRSCLSIYKDVDISKYSKLQAFLKRSSEGYVPKKSKILEEEDIHKFIREADDKIYLAMKIVLIMGYNGGCRREELTNMSVDDIQYKSDSILVSVPKTKNNVTRIFAVTHTLWINLIKKYANLRPNNVTHKRFFLTYRNGYCVTCPIGINIMGKVSKNIAAFLKLPNPELFTGHCFRRSSATHLTNSGSDMLTIKRHGGWQSSAVAEGYSEASSREKNEISQMLETQRSNSNLPGSSSASGLQFACNTNKTTAIQSMFFEPLNP